jgi:hypothetical protein
MTATASSDSGNPILGTIKASAVNNGNGTITVYVRGQWNWLSHRSDCNTDRAGAGVGVIWNDPTEPGFTVAKGGISAEVGIASLRPGDTANTVDQMVHPSDIGNLAEGYPGLSGQTFFDPSPPLPSSFASWRSGCGREPLTATASPGPGTALDPSGKPCADGSTDCADHPWGSWGYSVNGGKGYAHTYLASALPKQVCVNFYDVHGGGKVGDNNFQKPNSAKEITVNGNGDNSIETNSFNVNIGANCTSFPPTAVLVSSFAARWTKRGVALTWRSDSPRITGFQVYRNGVRLNRTLLASHRYLDRTAKRGSFLTYRLQIVSVDGQASWYGVSVVPTR